MIAETGHFAMILAFCVALVQSILPLYGAHRDRQAFVIIAAPAAKLQFILLLWAFAVLTIKLFNLISHFGWSPQIVTQTNPLFTVLPAYGEIMKDPCFYGF